MKNKHTLRLVTHQELKRELFRRPGVRKAYEELEFEFKIMDALIRARIKKKLTQRGLAQKIGVAQSALARFESGRTNPTLSFLKKVTVGLGLKLSVK
ncbi:MAG: helix-turn-helix transcriptional regulator [bacterium]|nr:helix-turn-helix transcriptional regulator [bacterium]